MPLTKFRALLPTLCPHILAACAAPLPAIGLLTFEQQVIPGEPSPKNGYR